MSPVCTLGEGWGEGLTVGAASTLTLTLSQRERERAEFATRLNIPMTARTGALSNFFLKLSDLTLLLVALGAAIVLRYAPADNPGFVVDYLSQRIKVTNAILGVLLIISWHAAFAA